MACQTLYYNIQSIWSQCPINVHKLSRSLQIMLTEKFTRYSSQPTGTRLLSQEAANKSAPKLLLLRPQPHIPPALPSAS